MKKLVICIIFLFVDISCMAQFIDTIKVYYLPWNLKTKGALKAEDVRNFNNGKNYYFEINNDSSIQEFDQALNIYNFKDTSKYKLIDVRMVLDFILSDKSIFSIELGAPAVPNGKSRSVKIATSYYENNSQLNYVIDKHIPEKLSLKGSPLKMKSTKGEFSQKQIEEFKQKGIIIEEE